MACAGSAQAPKPWASTDVVAKVGSTSITLADVDQRALRESSSAFGTATLAQALYEARRKALDEIVADLLIEQTAKARNVETSALVDREITAKVAPPSDADVASWYQANQGRLQGATLDQLRAPIRSLLTDERTKNAKQALVDELRKTTPVKITLEPPRFKVDTAGFPSRGPDNAPIVLVEFSDFECPFCLRAHQTLGEVFKVYGDRIRFVYRHYPLQNHPNARPAAEASACAAEQDKFWPYHDRLFANPTQLGAEDLKRHATAVGLDLSRFSTCVDSHKYRKLVEDDVAAGSALGVTGTPAFFINGRSLDGAQPFEVFKRLIDEELALQ
jgi:protein-disulfide isomerase